MGDEERGGAAGASRKDAVARRGRRRREGRWFWRNPRGGVLLALGISGSGRRIIGRRDTGLLSARRHYCRLRALLKHGNTTYETGLRALDVVSRKFVSMVNGALGFPAGFSSFRRILRLFFTSRSTSAGIGGGLDECLEGTGGGAEGRMDLFQP